MNDTTISNQHSAVTYPGSGAGRRHRPLPGANDVPSGDGGDRSGWGPGDEAHLSQVEKECAYVCLGVLR